MKIRPVVLELGKFIADGPLLCLPNIVELGFEGVYIIFLFLLKHRSWLVGTR